MENAEKNKMTVCKTQLENILPIIIEVISSGEGFVFQPSGWSMKPFIRPGKDTVKIVSVDKLNKYDAVLYRRANGAFVLHRIMRVEPEGYVMCGDNQYVLEYGITDDMIIAKLDAIYRKGRMVSCSSKLYTFFVHIWCDFFTVRKLYIKLKRSVGHKIRKIKRIIRKIDK